jgi:hypothetical protein
VHVRTVDEQRVDAEVDRVPDRADDAELDELEPVRGPPLRRARVRAERPEAHGELGGAVHAADCRHGDLLSRT